MMSPRMGQSAERRTEVRVPRPHLFTVLLRSDNACEVSSE
jgi:hypothetical protein